MIGRVLIFDTTLRDRAQASGSSLRLQKKLDLARQLDALGVDVIEAGPPLASPADAAVVRRIAAVVHRPTIACLARCRREDIERAAAALRTAERGRIHTFLPTSDVRLRAEMRITRDACLESATDAVRYARRHAADVQFTAEDATRSDLDFLCRVVDAVIRAGATTICLPDTVGCATPNEIRDLFTNVRSRVPGSDKVVFSARCHDDLGLAAANSLAAVQGGARQIETTVNGVSARGGSAALGEIVTALRRPRARWLHAGGVLTRGIDPPCDIGTVVRRDAVAREPDTRRDGGLNWRPRSEATRAEEVGITSHSRARDGRSGRTAVQRRCADLGLALAPGELVYVYGALKAIAEEGNTIFDEDVIAVARAIRFDRWLRGAA